MNSNKILETVADIAYFAGVNKYYTGDLRADVSSFIFLAKRFEAINENTDWENNDYMLAIEYFVIKMLLK